MQLRSEESRLTTPMTGHKIPIQITQISESKTQTPYSKAKVAQLLDYKVKPSLTVIYWPGVYVR